MIFPLVSSPVPRKGASYSRTEKIELEVVMTTDGQTHRGKVTDRVRNTLSEPRTYDVC